MDILNIFKGERLAMKMREDLFASILRQDIAFYDSHKSGEIMSRLTSDIQEFKSSFKQVGVKENNGYELSLKFEEKSSKIL